MATAEQCRKALERLAARISELDAGSRSEHLRDRTLSCRVPDLGVTFRTRLSPAGADPITQDDDAPPAQVRFTAKSDDVIAVTDNPGSFLTAWVTGRLKVEGNILDLLHLRKLF